MLLNGQAESALRTRNDVLRPIQTTDNTSDDAFLRSFCLLFLIWLVKFTTYNRPSV